MNLLKILDKLEADSGKLAKEEILRTHDSPELRKMLNYALDPYKVFYLKKVPEPNTKLAKYSPKTSNLDGMWKLLDQLRAREITGGDAREAVSNFLGTVSEDQQEILRRILRKDLRCGTSTGIVNKVFKDLVPEYKMTGAKGYDEEKLKTSLPRIAEPKYDGMRINFLLGKKIEDSEVVSGRSGKPVNTYDDFIPALFEIWPEGNVVIDGEGMGVGVSFQGGMSVIKRKESDGRAKKFVIFDVITRAEFDAQVCKVPFKERLKRRRAIPKHLQHMFEYPPNWEVTTVEEVIALFHKVREIDPATGKPKFEGLLVKRPDGGYHFKKHLDWMKVKPLETVDLEITGVREGTGKYKGMLGALEMKYKGQDVRAGTGFSDKERKEFWKHQKKIIGQIGEFEFMEETDDGKTRHAVFVRIRSYKGEKA